MGTQTLGRGRSGRRTGTIGSRALLGLALAGLLLAGCSAGADTGAERGADVGQAAPDELAGGERGGSAGDDAAGEGPDAAGSDAQGSQGSTTGDDEQGGGISTGTGTTSDDAGGRQVVTQGELAMDAPDPRQAAAEVVRQVEAAGGRVDDRHETAAQEADGVEASAELTVRVPSDAVDDVLGALEEVGTITRLDLGSDDVTAAALDLDARIRAMRLSVARMEDLLARAGSQEEIIAAENSLTERQAALEQLESERAGMAEKVALSTLRVSISTPPAPPAPEEPAPAPEEAPQGFLGGLSSGWTALLSVLGGVVTVLGLLLPWLALGGAVAWVVVLVRRRLGRRHEAGPGAAGASGPGASGPGGPRSGGSGTPGGDPTEPDPADPNDPRDRQPVGVG